MWKVLMVVFTGCLAVATASVLRQKSKDPQYKNSISFYKDCGSKGGKISSLDIKPCGTAPPCLFPRGTNVTIKLGFKSEELISAATTKVHGIFKSVEIPFPLPDPNACDDMKCPVNKGSDVIYGNVIHVADRYPKYEWWPDQVGYSYSGEGQKVELVMKWEIVDKADDDIICFEVHVKVTD